MRVYRRLLSRVVIIVGLALFIVATAAMDGPAARAESPVVVVQRAPGIVPPAISPLQLNVGGTEATVTFTTSVPTVVTISIQVVTATAAPPSPQDGLRVPVIGGAAAAEGGHAATVYRTQYQAPIKGLTSNTTYDLSVTATTQAGEQLVRKTRFTTLKRRVQVTLDSILLVRDGDWFGNGEPLWGAHLRWPNGEIHGCWPYRRTASGNTECVYGSFGTGNIFPTSLQGQPLSWTFAEENFDHFPGQFILRAWSAEDDVSWLPCVVCSFTPPMDPVSWQVPRGVEQASKLYSLDANGEIESIVYFTFRLFHDNLTYPAPRNTPHSTWR